MRNFRLLVSLLILMSSCPKHAPGQRSATAGDGGSGSPAGRWTLIRLVDGGGEVPLGESRTTLHFAPGGEVDGRAAVNGYQGEYAADATGNLRWPTPARATRMGGPAEHLRIESSYLHALGTTMRWEILPGGTELRLSDADGKTTLAFRRQDDAASSIPYTALQDR